MFSLFKSKPTLAELIPNNYVDIHSHVLPGIDDGAKNLKDSQFLLESMIGFGFKKCITSPHTMANVFNNTIESINSAKYKVENELSELAQKLDLQAASEYYIDENFIENFKNNPLLTLKDNYVLVEMSFLNPPIQLHEYLFELQLAGYQPVLAHPERYTFYHNSFKDFEKLKKMGLKFQLNLLSTVGYYGPDVAKISDKLLKAEFIDYVGSDIHHKQHISSFSRKIVIKETKAFETAIENNQFFL
ncbi:tyrosine-protein phosphatase [Flavobacterium urocaniciphilum]|uniref:protein-tyrosine-phosphatase n=1 Tax=Flavobacterium urocaniciphilum TaxID=1299341 RepID=A0A1H8YS32_9FLAO|nr:CpsB/CapC family capsule biosynthesis tyrosine phosphatase [Flavobacterium urocaniciphilum]SEP54811.1 Tyrosine-protein phosphatase YwqE [Flavobacterium urocaniciphilum]